MRRIKTTTPQGKRMKHQIRIKFETPKGFEQDEYNQATVTNYLRDARGIDAVFISEDVIEFESSADVNEIIEALDGAKCINLGDIWCDNDVGLIQKGTPVTCIIRASLVANSEGKQMNIQAVRDAVENAIKAPICDPSAHPTDRYALKEFYGEQAERLIKFAEDNPVATAGVCRAVGQLIGMISTYNEPFDDIIIHNQMVRVGAYLECAKDDHKEVDFSPLCRAGGIADMFMCNLGEEA
jgi:hypothetical protein